MQRSGTVGWWRRIGTAAVVLGLGYLLVWVVPVPFVRAWWAPDGTRADPLHLQHRMADWLVRRRRLDGLSRPAVLALLGAPRSHGYLRDGDLVYRLGDERGLISIDSEWLVVTLDDAGRVVRAAVVRD